MTELELLQRLGEIRKMLQDKVDHDIIEIKVRDLMKDRWGN
jgi:hypothetical protein